ncbi:MAG: plastocyanin/azurin family copper-binding protein [Fuerstiella sp.]
MALPLPMTSRFFLSSFCAIFLVAYSGMAQEGHQHHGEDMPVERPKILLDKNRRIVDYQLKRLDNAALLLVETATDDTKYLPVFEAILVRSGLSTQDRESALNGIVTLNETDTVAELLRTLSDLDTESRDQQQVARQLSAILLTQPVSKLAEKTNDLKTAAESENSSLKATALAAMISSNVSEQAWQIGNQSAESKQAWLKAVQLISAPKIRNTLRLNVVSLLDKDRTTDVRKAAAKALATITIEQPDTFARLAELFSEPQLRTVAVRAMLKIPASNRPDAKVAILAKQIVTAAEQTDPAKRTSGEFIDMMQLADQLLPTLEQSVTKEYRNRLREISVRVVKLHTVEEEMRYDQPFFAVEAGRSVQLVMVNDDLMPHNLVITKPGQLQSVAIAGAALGTAPGLDGKLYVPKSDDVLFATEMVNAGITSVLTFNAPTEPGEYPYVCTFPRHWVRMYGVMLVVPDLDQWQRNPTIPADPLGNTRGFVQKWQITDFTDEELSSASAADNAAILFKEATCLSCHKMAEQGGAVGPALDDVAKRWKGDRRAILREILDPSYRIDPKYATKIVIDMDGKTTSGMVISEDKKSISLLTDPETKEPTVIAMDDVDEIIPSSKSMMPKALLDKFTKEEIITLLNYIAPPK